MTKKFTVADISKTTEYEILQRICNFSVAISAVQEFSTLERAQFVGSGTLVRVGEMCGVLTAGHVLRNSRLLNGRPWDLTSAQSTQSIGIAVSPHTHRFVFPTEHLRFAGHWNLNENPIGPDIGVILLPDVGPKIETLRAIKSFYPIDRLEYKVECESLRLFAGRCWSMMGFPGEWVTPSDPNDIQPTTLLNGLCGLCGLNEGISESNGFDIVKASTCYDFLYEGPEEFSGMSGGGLWFCDLVEDVTGNLHPSDPILYGMPIFQEKKKSSERLINCHGMKVIYERAVELIKAAEV